MKHQLAKSSDRIQEALIKAGLQCKVLQLPNTARTATDAAMSIGCDANQIVKSLIFKTKASSKPVLVLASGPNRVSEKQIELQVGEEIIMADAEFVKEITGYTIGGIPPIGHKHAIDLIFIDQDLLDIDEVWAAAGTHHSVFCIKSKDLVHATKGKIISIRGLR